MLNTGPGIISARAMPVKNTVGSMNVGVRYVISIGKTTGPPPHTNMPAFRKGITQPWSYVSVWMVHAARTK